ncbi:hypothetical protein NA57DRAFT_80559 [Rhizodiscina lignyota]|uniref:Uncharacterized protein n=1 Tax=Rhizodiscina lignyota TaxID=1504668 RepID=A0A9P4I8T4_9PEZI|nr:hypothetical protein NA57DRAFT_80559 [Rhizodiscina lignyota]
MRRNRISTLVVFTSQAALILYLSIFLPPWVQKISPTPIVNGSIPLNGSEQHNSALILAQNIPDIPGVDHGVLLESTSSLNVSTEDLSILDSRQSTSSKADKEYLKQGKQLQCLMRKSYDPDETYKDRYGETLKIQSDWSTIQQLESNGWVAYRTTANRKVQQNSDVSMYGPVFQALGISPNWGSDGTVNWVNEGPADGSRERGTMASYVNNYNPQGGMIIQRHAVSPGGTSQSQLDLMGVRPPVQVWSDITFPEWNNQAHESTLQVMNIKYFLIHAVSNDDTNDILKSIVENPPKWGEPDNKYYPMQGNKALRLLASPNGRGPAWFLINHKAQLGVTQITGFKVFRSEISEGLASILFFVERVAPQKRIRDWSLFCGCIAM